MRYGRLCLNWEISIHWLAQSPDTQVRDMGPLPCSPKGLICHKRAAPYDPVKFSSRTQRNRDSRAPSCCSPIPAEPLTASRTAWRPASPSLLETAGDRWAEHPWNRDTIKTGGAELGEALSSSRARETLWKTSEASLYPRKIKFS